MFLLILLERILCLQRREDSGFFFCCFAGFFRLPGIVHGSKNSFLAQLLAHRCGKDPSKICLLTINALCSKGRSSCGTQLPPPQSQVTGLNRELLLVTCPAAKRFVPGPAGLS